MRRSCHLLSVKMFQIFGFPTLILGSVISVFASLVSLSMCCLYLHRYQQCLLPNDKRKLTRLADFQILESIFYAQFEFIQSYIIFSTYANYFIFSSGFNRFIIFLYLFTLVCHALSPAWYLDRTETATVNGIYWKYAIKKFRKRSRLFRKIHVTDYWRVSK